MVRRRKDDAGNVTPESMPPCFGHFDEKEAGCDAELCRGFAACQEATENPGKQKQQKEEKMAEEQVVDLNEMDRDELIEFADEQGIDLEIDDEATEEDIRTALSEYLESLEGEEAESEGEEAETEEEPEEPEEGVEEEVEEEEVEEEEAEEPETTAGGGGGKTLFKGKGGGGGVKVDRLNDGVLPVTFKSFKEALKKEFGSLKEKKSIINVMLDDTQFMGVARKGSTANKVQCIVYGSGKWDLPKELEKKVGHWTDTRHSNEVKVTVSADDIDGAMNTIKQLAKFRQNLQAKTAKPEKKEKEAEKKQKPKATGGKKVVTSKASKK